MSSILSGAKDIIFGNEQKIAKPISNFTGIGFNAPGLGVETFKGGFDLSRTPANQTALNNLSGSFNTLSTELGALKPLVSPAFGNLSKAGSQAIEDARRRTVGDLRQNLSRRKVAGSSFAADDVARVEAEFAKKDAEFQATTKLQEIEATAKITIQQYEAAAKGAESILSQGNFESTLAAELSRQYTGALADLAKFESELLRDEADGITAAIGAGTTALLSGALGGIASGLFGGGAGAAAGGAAGAAAGGAAAGFGLLGTQIPGVGTIGGVATGAGLGFLGNRLAKSLPGDQTNIESNIGAIAGTGIGAAFFGPVGAGVGGFVGTAIGSAVNSVFGKKGGGENKADYSIAVNQSGTTYGTGLGSDGVWGSVGLGHQKHISNTAAFQSMFDNVTKVDESVSRMFTPEQNAAIKAEIEKGGIIKSNSNEGGFSPARAAKVVFDNRAKALSTVLGPEAFEQTGLRELYTALAAGNKQGIEAVFNKLGGQ